MSSYFCRYYSGKVQRLSKALPIVYPELGYAELMRILRKKDIFVNGKRIGADTDLNSGDSVDLYLTPQAVTVREIYADNNILVLFKNRGVVSDGEYSFEGLVKYKYGAECRLLHRLDTNTEGLLMFSRRAAVYDELRNAMKEGKIIKYYYARVNGKVKDRERVLKGYLKKDSLKGIVKIFDKPTEGADYVEAEIKTLSYEGDSTLLEVKICGGKTHQIRAQLAHYGHFILGDSKYGKDEINRMYNLKRQQLTAYKIVMDINDNGLLGYLKNKIFES